MIIIHQKMKNIPLILPFAIIVFICFSWNTSQSQTMGKNTEKEITITGIVTAIENGKDGYTAQIQTDDKQIYYATISNVNLGENASKYRRFTIGERVSVTGEFWELGTEKRITVRDIN